MRYKIGDKVKIKTWKEMEEEFGVSYNGDLMIGHIHFFQKREEELVSNNRIVKIDYISDRYYNDSGKKYSGWYWTDEMIKGLIEPKILDPILSRFEILDL